MRDMRDVTRPAETPTHVRSSSLSLSLCVCVCVCVWAPLVGVYTPMGTDRALFAQTGRVDT